MLADRQNVRSQAGVHNSGGGSFAVTRISAADCFSACSVFTGYQYLHCWPNAAPGNLPPNSLALWDYASSNPPPLPDYTFENGRCLRKSASARLSYL